MAPTRSSLRSFAWRSRRWPRRRHQPAAATHGGAVPAGQPLPINPREPITSIANQESSNYKTQKMVCSNIVISQGSTRVTADHAAARAVQFPEQPLDIHRQRAHRCSAARQPALGPGDGGVPQQSHHQRDGQRQPGGIRAGAARAVWAWRRAMRIRSCMTSARAPCVLTKDAWVSDGHNEMSAPSISYSIREQKVLANSPGASQGVHIAHHATIRAEARLAAKELPTEQGCGGRAGAGGAPCTGAGGRRQTSSPRSS